MKFPAALVLVLAIGILSYNSAVANTRMGPKDIMPFYLNNIMRSISQDILNYGQNAYNPIVIRKCETNGGYTAHSDAIASLESLKNSVNSMMTKAIRESIPRTEQRLKPRRQFAKICRMSQTLNDLATRAFEPVKRCLTQEEQQKAYTGHNYTMNILNHVCENNGSRALSFWRAHGVVCLMEKITAVMTCAEGYSSLVEPAAVDTVDEIGTPWSYSASGPNLEQCRRFEIFRNCILEQLKTCKKTAPFEVANDVLNFMKTETGCDKLLATAA